MFAYRTGLKALGAACLSLACWSPAFAVEAPVDVPVYNVTPLPAVTGLRINQAGDVVGWTTVNGPAQPILYTRETGVIVLPTSTSQTYGVARDLSDRVAGVITVVGEAKLNSSGSAIHAVRWKVAVPQGSVVAVTDLGTLPGATESFAQGVNNSGQIVGTSDPSSSLSIRSFIYADNTGMVDLGLGAPGTNARALDVNASGVVTGYLGLQAFRWRSGSGVELLGVPGGWAHSFGFAINASGQVAGYAGNASGNAERVARYTDGSGWKILGGSGEFNEGNGINQWGDVAGSSGASFSSARAVLYTDKLGLLAFVDDLLMVPGSWRIQAAYDINDAQQITGRAYNTKTGLSSAVVLTPVNPPPANQPPVAAFSASCTASFYCTFDGSASSDDRAILAWVWTVNGQQIGVGTYLEVQYAAAQTINVTLTVTDSRGATDAITKPVVVGATNQPPVARFTSSCNVPAKTCTFHGGTSSDDVGIVSYRWSFGDGGTGSGASVSHSYAARGSYPVTLTVADGGGLTNSLTSTVTLSRRNRGNR
jgi:probable HAF family extracellular repeat protein